TRFPRCKWSAPLVVGQCPACGGELVERQGKRGAFWGCSRYPECRHTQEPLCETEQTASPPSADHASLPSG
ncbi:MAG: hypothetical protein GWN58_68610, partial [Anaerolineae bacterium]|nr:hypothetical protein [Anaerolineae bacterium]